MTLDRESQQEVVFNIVACLVFCLELRSVGRYNPFYLVLVQGGTHVESPSLDIKDQVMGPVKEPDLYRLGTDSSVTQHWLLAIELLSCRILPAEGK